MKTLTRWVIVRKETGDIAISRLFDHPDTAEKYLAFRVAYPVPFRVAEVRISLNRHRKTGSVRPSKRPT